ncbi:MAG: hypothetical protein IPL41_05700 [Micropruina sp.]|nr:hypothetical protein [Micropruina sp.]
MKYEGRTREGFDPDNFGAGFGTWTGSSFSAPLLAGRIAASLLRDMPADEDEARKTGVERGWKAIEKHTELRIVPN